ncbi:hypothetical protein HAX54_026598, partial [Datura stramonium]|nr:hypothetical protein [Datura stramonium]
SLLGKISSILIFSVLRLVLMLLVMQLVSGCLTSLRQHLELPLGSRFVVLKARIWLDLKL